MTKETKILRMVIFLLLSSIFASIYYTKYWKKEAYYVDSVNLMRNYLSMRLPGKAEFKKLELENKFSMPTFWAVLRSNSIADIDEYINSVQAFGFALKKKEYILTKIKNAKNQVEYIFVRGDQKYSIHIFDDGAITESLSFIDETTRW